MMKKMILLLKSVDPEDEMINIIEDPAEVEEYCDDLKHYIKKNGYHFTEDLALMACKDFMQFPKIDMTEIELPKDITAGDLLYYSNYLYSILVPTILPPTSPKIKEIPNYALALLEGDYPEMVFSNFLNDVKWCEITIDWKTV